MNEIAKFYETLHVTFLAFVTKVKLPESISLENISLCSYGHETSLLV